MAVGRRWSQLPPEQRADVVTILNDIEAGGLTLREPYGMASGAVRWPDPGGEQVLGRCHHGIDQGQDRCESSTRLRRQLGQYLRRWSKGQEAKPVSTVKLDEIDAFLTGLPSFSSRMTAINRLWTLFSFAVRRGWRADNPCERVERPRVENGAPSILTVEEAKTALDYARQEMPRFLPGWRWLCSLASAPRKPTS